MAGIQPLRLKEIELSERIMISESFDRRTLANMEIALERACEALSTGSEKHRTRRHIASRIIRCAKSGNRSLGSLTAAALAAAKELRVERKRISAAEAPAAIAPSFRTLTDHRDRI
jgi:hypothetical protein